MRSLAVLVLAGVVLAGCGQDAGDAPASGGDAGAGGGAAGVVPTSLEIEVRVSEDAQPRLLTLTCDPAGGDHPQPQQACETLAAAGAEIFEPVPRDQVCTMILGGPETAEVTGTYEGVEVSSSFSRANGCEMSRWDALGTTFFAVPMQ